MYCGQCGKYNDNNGRFCGNCGNNLQSNPSLTNTNNQVNYNNMNNIQNSQMNYNNSNNQAIYSNANNNQNYNNINNQMNYNNVAGNQNNNPKKKKKSGCLKVFIVFLLIIGIIIGLFWFLTRPKETEREYEYTKEFEYFSTLDSGEVIINHVKEDVEFYVSSDAIYEVYDSNGQLVNTKLDKNKIVNSADYKKGEEYTIILKNGSFLSEQLKETKKVKFKIERDEVKKHKYTSNVVEVKEENMKLSDDKSTFTSNNTYKIGDVIVIKENNIAKEAYVVENATGDTYNVRLAEMNEIYSELDLYYEEYADLSNYEVSNQIKDYLVSNIENSYWYNNLVETVYAEPKIKINLEKIKKGKGLKAEITISIKAGDDSFLIDSDFHDIDIVITETLIVNQLVDVSLTDWNVSLNITTTQDFELKFKNEYILFESVRTKKANREILDKIKDSFKKAEYEDEDLKETDISTISIPTPIAGLAVKIELELLNEITFSTEFAFGATQTTNVVVGFDYGVGEKFKFVGDYNKELTGVDVSFVGKLEYKLGLELSVGLSLINVVSAKANVATGLYTEAELSLEATPTTYTVSAGTEGGIFLEFGISASVGKLEKKRNFVDKKWKLFDKDWSYKYQDDEDAEASDTESNIEPESKLSYNEQVNNLERYSCILPNETGYIKYKFNYKKNSLDNVEANLVYKIDTGSEFGDSLSRFLVRFLVIHYGFEYKTLMTVSDQDKYTVINAYFNKKNYRRNLALPDNSDDNYYYIKSVLESEGYTCK